VTAREDESTESDDAATTEDEELQDIMAAITSAESSKGACYANLVFSQPTGGGPTKNARLEILIEKGRFFLCLASQKMPIY